MKKELFVTIVLALALGASVLLLGGCAPKTTHSSAPIYPGADISEQDIFIIAKIGNMEVKSDCLTCLGCVVMSGPADCCGNVDGQYYGCIDCFGVTTGDADTASDYYSATKIADSCYCVNLPLSDGEDGYVPVYGCLMNAK